MDKSTVIPSLTPSPTPTSVGCLPNSAPTLRNVTRLSGPVCQINFPPKAMDISSCCKEGVEVRVQEDCTQYCEADQDQAKDFRKCVVKMLENPPVNPIAAYCQTMNMTVSPTPGSSATPTPDATQSSDLPESAGTLRSTQTSFYRTSDWPQGLLVASELTPLRSWR
jgi:hypothetical protein